MARKINVITNKNSLQIRLNLKGVTYSKTWGDKDSVVDRARMEYIAAQVAIEIQEGTFLGLEKFFKDNEVWDKSKLIDALNKKMSKDRKAKSLVKHLKAWQGPINEPIHVKNFFDSKTWQPSTKARYLSVIRYVAPGLTDGISYAQSTGQPDPFTVSEQQDLMIKLMNKPRRLNALIAVWMDGGFRTGELAAIQKPPIDVFEGIFIESTWDYERRSIKTTKTGKHRRVPLSTETWKLIIELNKDLQESDFLFPELQQPSNWINRTWKPLLLEAGIRYRKPYCMRHTAISTKIVNYKGDLARVALESGNSIEVISKHYAGVINSL